MEYLPLSLTQCLETHQDLPLQIKYSILLDVAKGLNYLHCKKPFFVHRDLTANNILLTSNFIAKISDLGVSRMHMADSFKRQKLTKAPGNAVVMPPEALKDKPSYDHKLDVFSYGCLILHVFTHQWPNPTDQYVPDTQHPGKHILIPEWSRRTEYTTAISSDNPFFSFAKSCLDNDPKKRPTMSDATICAEYAVSNLPPLKNKLEMIKENNLLTQQLQENAWKMQQEKQQAQDNAHRLEHEKKQAQDNARQLEQEKKQAQDNAHQLEREKKQAQDNAHRLEHEKKQAQDNARQLEREKKQAQDNAHRLEQEKKQAQDNARQLEQEKKQAQDNARQLEQEKKQAQDNVYQLEHEKKQAQDNARQLEQEKKQAQDNARQLEHEKKQAQDNTHQLEREKKQAQDNACQLEQEKKEALATVHKLKEENKQILDILHEKEAVYEQMKEEKEVLESIEEVKKPVMERLEKEIEELQTTLETTKTKVKNFDFSLEESSKQKMIQMKKNSTKKDDEISKYYSIYNTIQNVSLPCYHGYNTFILIY